MKFILYLTLCLGVLLPLLAAQAGAAERFSALVFTKTAGFRHDSIPDGIAAVKKLAADNDFSVDATEDASIFASDSLDKYRVIIFLSTTGDVLNEAEEAGLQQWLQAGNGLVGIHAAADTEYEWEWYGGAIGAYFKNHPPGIHEAAIDVEDGTHVSTAHLPERWIRTDEWYNYQQNPRENVHVLLTLDESTFEGGEMGDHPIAWMHEYDGGRVWYTGGGHTSESFDEPDFVQHMLGGITWAAGL